MLQHAYRLARAADEQYALAVFWLYVGLFIFTFALIFVFPPGAILMVFVALAGLLVAVVIKWLVRGVHHGLGRLVTRRDSGR